MAVIVASRNSISATVCATHVASIFICATRVRWLSRSHIGSREECYRKYTQDKCSFDDFSFHNSTLQLLRTRLERRLADS